MTCSICFDNFGDKETHTHYASGAPHEWHKECLRPMVDTNFNCPLRCGYRYSEKDFFSLQDRIMNASNRIMNGADFVGTIRDLFMDTIENTPIECILKATKAGVFVAIFNCSMATIAIWETQGIDFVWSAIIYTGSNTKVDFWSCLNLLTCGHLILKAMTADKTLQGIVNDPEIIEHAETTGGITANEFAFSMTVSHISAFAIGAALSAINYGLFERALASGLVGGALAVMSVAWKRFNR